MPWLSGLLALASILLFGVLYNTEFSHSHCSSGGVACVLNHNQGYISAYGLTIALLAVAYTELIRLADNYMLRAQFRNALDHSLYETVHNLRHLSESFDGYTLTSWPEYSVRTLKPLLESPFERLLLESTDGPLLWIHLDHIMRNDDMLRRISATPGAPTPPQEAADLARYMTSHMLRFLIRGCRSEDVRSRVFGRVRTPDRLSGLTSVLEDVKDPGSVLVRFRATKAEEWIARSGDKTTYKYIVCWVADGPTNSPGRPAGVEVCAVGPGFESLVDPP